MATKKKYLTTMKTEDPQGIQQVRRHRLIEAAFDDLMRRLYQQMPADKVDTRRYVQQLAEREIMMKSMEED